MKINRENIVIGSIERFASIYCLEMVIKKVGIIEGHNTYYKYYAYFQGISVQTNSGTAFVQGYGDTEEEAIKNYARHIKLHRLITEKGKYIYVWDLK